MLILGLFSIQAQSKTRSYDGLSETGLYESTEPFIISSKAIPFKPQFPLWSDGLEKKRWMMLPAGTQIDNTDPNHFQFPVGTKFWKEFSGTAPDGRIFKIETRFLEKTSSTSWTALSFQWSADQSHADQAPATGVKDVWELTDGKLHNIPSQNQCIRCHQGGPDRILGFSGLQLSEASNYPPDPMTVPLSQLESQGIFKYTVVKDLKFKFVRQETEGALGYFYGNCMSCHRASGSAGFTGLSFDLNLNARHGMENFGLQSTLEVPSGFPVPGYEYNSARIRAGKADQSSVWYRLYTETPGERMPAIGTVSRDPVGSTEIIRWINSLLIDGI